MTNPLDKVRKTIPCPYHEAGIPIQDDLCYCQHETDAEVVERLVERQITPERVRRCLYPLTQPVIVNGRYYKRGPTYRLAMIDAAAALGVPGCLEDEEG